MEKLFNNDWEFCEIPLTNDEMYKDGKAVLLNPASFFETAKSCDYDKVTLPHDWMIYHVKDLYKNSVGCYRKKFTIAHKNDAHKNPAAESFAEIPDDQSVEKMIADSHFALRFEGVYMNCAVWVNSKKAGEWKYGYSTFEFDISKFVKSGENEVIVIAVYQSPNTRWYSGAGIFRDVHFIQTQKTFLVSDGTYFVARPCDENNLNGKWSVKLQCEVAGQVENHKLVHTLLDKKGNAVAFTEDCSLKKIPEADSLYLKKNVPSVADYELFESKKEIFVENPNLWSTKNPELYLIKTELYDKNGKVVDSVVQNFGFKSFYFDKNKGFFLNGEHLKIYGACQHHDLGAFGSAFDKNALRRQFLKLQEMGINSVRCSHNPPPKAWMDLADEMGILIDDEAFDMWEKPKTTFDYGNYFNEWFEKDTVSWVRKDRNHPCLIMWSIGNEIYDTHVGNGLEITKKLKKIVEHHDPYKNGLVTIGSNYMMTDGAQNCAQEIDVVGYNYLERLYQEHHKKYPEWKIYGSETSSTVQSRGIYHFPESLKLVTFSDGQCSALGNCSTPWSAPNTQTVITKDRDFEFSAGQYIWTGWDYIGEPTPYHTKNSYFGQIDTAGFPKDTFYLYKSEWAYKNTAPFVHLLPYWDWNEGQIIDVKAYTNAEAVELFFNGKSLGKQIINHQKGSEPFGRWQVEYHKGEIKAVAYDENDKPVAQEVKKSFGDPEKIILKPEDGDFGNLHFIDIMTVDKDGELVENARNYITFNVTGDAELIGMDNGDSTDYDEYKSCGRSLTRKLFSNRLVAIVRINKTALEKGGVVITAASKDLPTVSYKFDGKKWTETSPYLAIKPEKDLIPARKIEIIAQGETELSPSNKEISVICKVLPENATFKTINWNPVLKECVFSDYIRVTQKKGENTGTETAVIQAVCDGECILRCTAQNGTELDEVLSDLNFKVEGLGNPKLNPYKMIEACRQNNWDKTRQKATVCLESGISNRGIGPTWISFDKVDFGIEGADTIHIPIFSFETEIPVEVWDGTPGDGTTYEGSVPSQTGECLGKFIYKHESIYNTYSENVFVLGKRLFGSHTISIVLPRELYFHGFYFDKTKKALSKLRALDADMIAGDSYNCTAENVEKIGNNVCLDFNNMDFGEQKVTKLIVCGKSNTENNTINVKFFNDDGSNTTQVIEFSHTDDYEQREFNLEAVTGKKKVSFVFLPGCNFDFKWFRFE